MPELTTQRPPPRPPFELSVYIGQQLQVVPLPFGSVVTIGRAADNDIQLDDVGVSRQHARLHVAEDVDVEDLGSANGTALVRHSAGVKEDTSNRQHLIEAHSLTRMSPGDVLRVGGALLVLERTRLREGKISSVSPGEQSFVLVDPAMRRAYDLATRAAASDITVLILGETGVGKEVMAEALHRRSPRAKHPFLKLNCAALPESLLEGELFGHERGSFTGAHATKTGLIEATDKGSVFLDEIGEMPLSTQSKLLRVIEERTVLRIGASKSRTVDVRFITATNRVLSAEVRAGRFRSDLYYRISGLLLEIPPLRQRTIEIEPLARHFLATFCRRSHIAIPRVTQGAIDALIKHRWPGNVRELRNVIERAALLSVNAIITPEQIVFGPQEEDPEPVLLPPTPPPTPPPRIEVVEEHVPSTRVVFPPGPRAQPDGRDTERARVLDALATCGGNQTRAAKLLGFSRRTLINRLDEFQLPRPKKG